MKHRIAYLVLIVVFAFACGGGSNESTNLKNFALENFTGNWEVEFNVVVDECELTEPDVVAFDDSHQIDHSGQVLNVVTSALPNGFYSGEARASDSFVVNSELVGDLFGDGISCTLTEELAYNEATQNSALTVYHVRLSCADGFSCDSALRGRATRQTNDS